MLRIPVKEDLGKDFKIPLGQQGEDHAITYCFDCSEWEKEFPGGMAALLIVRPGDHEEYLATTTQNGSELTWEVSKADTAYAGTSLCQIDWVFGGGIAKTFIFKGRIDKSISGGQNPPTEVTQKWIDQIVAEAQKVITSAEGFENLAKEAIADLANASKVAVGNVGLAGDEALDNIADARREAKTFLDFYSEQLARDFEEDASAIKNEILEANEEAQAAKDDAVSAKNEAETIKDDIETKTASFVKTTDYATDSKAGVVRTNATFNTYTNNGELRASAVSVDTYNDSNANAFTSIGTLKNVLKMYTDDTAQSYTLTPFMGTLATGQGMNVTPVTTGSSNTVAFGRCSVTGGKTYTIKSKLCPYDINVGYVTSWAIPYAVKGVKSIPYNTYGTIDIPTDAIGIVIRYNIMVTNLTLVRNYTNNTTVVNRTYSAKDTKARDDISKVSNEITGKVDKEDGKGLSSNDYTDAEKAKVDAIPNDPKYTDTVYDDTAIRADINKKADKTDIPNPYDDTEIKGDVKLLKEGLATQQNTKVGYSEVVDGQLLMYSDDTKEHLLATLDLPSGGNVNDVQIDGTSILDENKNANFESSDVETVDADHFSLFEYVEYVSGGGTTETLEKVNAILNDNKIPYTFAQSRYLIYCGSSAGYHYFSTLYAVGNTSSAYFCSVNKTTGKWSNCSYRGLEQVENRIDTIIGNETNTAKYPSAKAIFDYAEPKKGDWVLKGTLTTENKENGVNVDLTGCTEVFIKGDSTGTGDVYLFADNTYLMMGVARNGYRKTIIKLKNFFTGYEVEYAKTSNTDTVFIGTSAVGYNDLTGKKVSDIKKFKFGAPSVVTECNLEIYAR